MSMVKEVSLEEANRMQKSFLVYKPVKRKEEKKNIKLFYNKSSF